MGWHGRRFSGHRQVCGCEAQSTCLPEHSLSPHVEDLDDEGCNSNTTLSCPFNLPIPGLESKFLQKHL
jgi:hypothetical protein